MFLGKLGLKDGEVITHSMITKSLERAQQKKVESHNYDLRKQILKFDDILNDQRKIIYQNRRYISTNDQSSIINEMIDDFIDNLIKETIPSKKYVEDWNSESFKR